MPPAPATESPEELARSRRALVERLGHLAEYKEDPGGRHVVRVGHYARQLGQWAGMGEAEAARLGLAATLHDVGKIAIPEAILTKPGPLDPAEWETMKTHTRLGAEILAGDDDPLLAMAREVALTHHERWAGGGYPRGLAGEDIPLTGRIVCLADAFDALTSARPYKAPWPIEQAVSLVRHESGQLFDPHLVDLFLSGVDGILRVRAQYAETGVPGA